MRRETGLVIAGETGSLDRDQLYDSRKPKLTMDPKPNPPHFDLLENFSAGTIWSFPAGSTDRQREEDLLKIRHGLPFTPMFAAFFVPTSTPSEYRGRQAQYSINLALMVYNAAAYGEEWLEATADETYFYIKHKVNAFGGDAYTFLGSKFQYRVRYMIFNQPSFIIEGGIVPR